jgi:hypothetical protein
MQPPRKLDGAWVREWAWSDMPFGEVAVDGGRPKPIRGLAICQYEVSSRFYRLSCDENWQTIADLDCSSVDEAKGTQPDQFRNVRVVWHSMVH